MRNAKDYICSYINKLSEKISSTKMILWTEARKNYRIRFLATSGISSCSISQGKIISVNWLLCYRFFDRLVIIKLLHMYYIVKIPKGASTSVEEKNVKLQKL